MFARRTLLPWLFSALAMAGLSWTWHGLLLTDLEELHMPMGRYFGWTACGYLLLGLALCKAVQFAVDRDWMAVKRGFPLHCMLIGSGFGLLVFCGCAILGLSFTGNGLQHVLADLFWQLFEQGMGGLAVSAGMIWDMHRGFMETERAK